MTNPKKWTWREVYAQIRTNEETVGGIRVISPEKLLGILLDEQTPDTEEFQSLIIAVSRLLMTGNNEISKATRQRLYNATTPVYINN
jgi:hypothetical protein